MGYQIPLKEYDPDLKREYEFWDACTKMSDRALGKFHRAVVKYHGSVTDSMVLTNGFPDSKVSYMEVHYRLRLPKGLKDRFEEEWGGVLKNPPEFVSY